jgi:hypothetical protein
MYKPLPIPIGKKVTRLRLIKEYDEYWKKYFPEDMKVGDETWTDEIDKDFHPDVVLIEGNRYGGNFLFKYFEVITDNMEPIYKIY